jgi:hypothetical protein
VDKLLLIARSNLAPRNHSGDLSTHSFIPEAATWEFTPRGERDWACSAALGPEDRARHFAILGKSPIVLARSPSHVFPAARNPSAQLRSRHQSSPYNTARQRVLSHTYLPSRHRISNQRASQPTMLASWLLGVATLLAAVVPSSGRLAQPSFASSRLCVSTTVPHATDREPGNGHKICVRSPQLILSFLHPSHVHKSSQLSCTGRCILQQRPHHGW